jgi:F-type H+-transporting ATPase subunit epsilon
MFNLRVLTPDSIFYDEHVSSVVVPAALGYLGVLTDHAPLIASLKEGIVTIRRKEEQHYYKISGGFIEVNHNKVFLLVDSIESTSPPSES